MRLRGRAAVIRHGVNPCATVPGVVDREHRDGVNAIFARCDSKPSDRKRREVGAAVRHGRMRTPEDITGAAAFPATPHADCIVAQTLDVEGGNWMS